MFLCAGDQKAWGKIIVRFVSFLARFDLVETSAA